MHYIFVYGTLKRGFHNHRLLLDQEFIGEAKTKEPKILRSAGIPFVYDEHEAWIGCLMTQGHQVHGEIFKVTPEALKKLDGLEGHPTWYQRTPCDLLSTEMDTIDEPCTAEIYYMRSERETKYNKRLFFPRGTEFLNSFEQMKRPHWASRER